jgi:hypothetical protein
MSPAYGYRNPCPSGSGIGYETINNVTYLICSPDFKQTAFYQSDDMPGVGLGVGLGLGLGIPLMFVLIGIFLYCCCRPNRRLNPPPAVTPAIPTEADNYEAVRQKLSPISFNEAYQGSTFVTIGESDPIPSLPAPASASAPPDTKISISYPTAVATAPALTPGQQVTLAMMEARPYHEQYVQRERTALDDYLKYSSENKK